MAGTDGGKNWGFAAHGRQQSRVGESSRRERRPDAKHPEPDLPQVRTGCASLWACAEDLAGPNILEAQSGIKLTPQKWRVLRQLAQGFSNREISERLGMSRLVCKNHIGMILERTGMGTRLELALWYWEKCEDRGSPGSRTGDRFPALQAAG